MCVYFIAVGRCSLLLFKFKNTYKNEKIDNDCSGYCGYLASMASMAGGADTGYIFEEKFGITELKRDLDSMVSKMDKKMVYR